MQSILVVEDEQDLVDLLRFNLKAAGFEVVVAMNAADALVAANERALDLVLLDLMLPDLPGTEVCRKLKASARTKAVPVIMVTARGEEVDRVVGFELGADDFVTKPFSMRELLLRIKAVLRRGPAEEQQPQRTAIGEVRIDLDSHRAYVSEKEVELTALEFKLLHNFMSRAGRLQTRETLLRDVWGISSNLQTRTVDTHVKRLREKLGDGRELIETVRGAGYRMVDPADA
jgi:two-component system phosphate regulon response regulator PhoB